MPTDTQTKHACIKKHTSNSIMEAQDHFMLMSKDELNPRRISIELNYFTYLLLWWWEILVRDWVFLFFLFMLQFKWRIDGV